MSRSALYIPVVLLATACRPPSISPPAITVTQARVEDVVGQQVRCGVEVASVTPTERETCLEIIDRPLASDGKPPHSEETDGRFLACTPRFYPRGLYEGQDVTVAGTLKPPATGKLDELEYRYPRVAVESLTFWPRVPSALSGRYGSRWWQPPDQGSEGYWW